MKKLILGTALLLCGAIGFIGTLIACAANEIDGGFSNILICMQYNGGTPLAVLSGILFFAGLGLAVYSVVKDKDNDDK